MSEAKKLGKRKPQECPYCHKFFGNIKNHILMKHQTEEPAKAAATELTREDLLAKPKPKAKEEKDTYYCMGCHASLRYKESPCSQCGQVLDWSKIK